MQSLNTPRRDPAPSRLSYRLQRLWLTPLFRRLVRFGVPVLLIALSFVWYFQDTARRDALTENIAEIRRSIEERPEFMVNLMAIDGASDSVADDIREVVPVDFPVSSFDLDLDGMQARILELDPVARADIRIRQGGVLQVTITERQPAAVWRFGRNIELLDAQGYRVAVIKSRLKRADLPLLAGTGAQNAVPEALEILATAAPIRERVRGLIRVGERRWDMMLDRNQRIMLPETRPIDALEKVLELHRLENLLARDISVVDMRQPQRVTLRLAPGALAERADPSDANFGEN
ncbi:MAG: cell division protein FtsQ/DivIB [Paracoccaceae bacterium]